MDYKCFRVDACPSSVFYIPSFLSEQEEELILSQIENTPKPKWTQLSNRRLINYGGVPHKNGMIAERLPDWLNEKVNAVNNLGIFDNVAANHVLVNEYLPGQGIMAHFDGPLFHPVICTISCGSHTILQFHEDDSRSTIESNENNNDATNHSNVSDMKRKIVFELLVERRSLLILKDDMYQKYLHSIAEVTHDVISPNILNLKYCKAFSDQVNERIQRERRISLTIRHVPKTSKKIHLRLGH